MHRTFDLLQAYKPKPVLRGITGELATDPLFIFNSSQLIIRLLVAIFCASAVLKRLLLAVVLTSAADWVEI
jgi:hypothetical protein